MSFLSRLRKSVTSKTKVNNNNNDNHVLNNNDRRNSATPSSNFSVVNQKVNATVIKGAKAVGKKQSIDKSKVDSTRKRPTSINGGAIAADKNRFLHRSDTFTLKEEPSPISKSDGGSTIRADKNKFGTYSRKEASIKTDVFETLYTKRPSKSPKSSKSSRSSNDSFHGSLNSPTIEVLPSERTNVFNPDSILKKRTPLTALKSSLVSSNKPLPSLKQSSPTKDKPSEYLFGTLERPTVKTKLSQNTNKLNEDKFRTITIKDVRRSFRDAYLKNDDKPEKQFQPLWFIDVNKNDEALQKDKDNSEKNFEAARRATYIDATTPPTIRRPTTAAVSRKETFRITRNKFNEPQDDYVKPATGTSLSRKETFKIERPETSRIQYYRGDDTDFPYKSNKISVVLKSPLVDRSGKVVPIGIATPYNLLSDYDENSLRRRGTDKRSESNPEWRKTFTKFNSDNKGFSTFIKQVHSKLDTVPDAKSKPVFDSSTYKRPAEAKNEYEPSFNFKEKDLKSKVESPLSLAKNRVKLGFEKFYNPPHLIKGTDTYRLPNKSKYDYNWLHKHSVTDRDEKKISYH